MAAPPKGTTTIRINDENSSVSDDERMNSYDDGVMQYTTYHNSNEHEYEDDDETQSTSPPIYDDYVLDGCRWMFQRATANSTTIAEDAEDPYIDAFERWQIQINENCREFQTEVDRRADVVLDVLKKIKAFSHDDLVKGYLFCIDEYFGGSTEFARYDQKVTSTLKSVLDRSGFSTSFHPSTRPSNSAFV
jgi:ABC-type Zn2+ transport system substrate-binding protein/surface adhesin